jgi:ankyrin repeat protein
MRKMTRILTTVALAVLALICIAFLVLSTPYEVADDPTPLMKAARLGDVEQVRELLAAGAHVNERRGFSTHRGVFIAHGPSTALYGDTALMAAIESRDVATVSTLLNAGADPTGRDSWGRDIWEYAVNSLSGSGADVLVLLATRIDMPTEVVDRILGQVGYTDDTRMLDFALSRRNSASARESALCGAAGRADIEMMTRILQTLDGAPRGSLICATSARASDRTAAIELLISRGADPNGDDQTQPLSWALLTLPPGAASVSVPSDVRDLLEVLLRHGADPYLALPGAPNPIDLARRQGHEAAAVLLENWVACSKSLGQSPTSTVRDAQQKGDESMLPKCAETRH